MSVCGIDLGSFKTPSYVAWLEGKDFFFDLYIISKEKPLPSLPTRISKLAHCALDGPQSLPLIGNKRRECDKRAKTPTSVLPLTRQELSEWKMYKQLIECGIEVFWNTYEKNLSAVAGLNDHPNSDIIIFETYPRYVIKRLWFDEEIPSKRKAPFDYVRKFSFLLKQKGYSFDESKISSPDYIDAMLCAIAAEDFMKTKGHSVGKVGQPPLVDRKENILREGFIYSP